MQIPRKMQLMKQSLHPYKQSIYGLTFNSKEGWTSICLMIYYLMGRNSSSASQEHFANPAILLSWTRLLAGMWKKQRIYDLSLIALAVWTRTQIRSCKPSFKRTSKIKLSSLLCTNCIQFSTLTKLLSWKTAKLWSSIHPKRFYQKRDRVLGLCWRLFTTVPTNRHGMVLCM